VWHDHARGRSGLVQLLHLSMSDRGNACQHVTLLLSILLTCSSGIAAAAQPRAGAGTASRRIPAGSLTSWWRSSYPHDFAQGSAQWQAPHSWVNSALTQISERGRQWGPVQTAEDLPRDTAVDPAGPAVAAERAKTASCISGRATCTTHSSERGKRISDRSASAAALPGVPSSARSAGGGLLPQRWWRAQHQAPNSVPGGHGRRSLTAAMASGLPRAALEDVLLTDDELAFTESGVETSVLSTSEESPLAPALCTALRRASSRYHMLCDRTCSFPARSSIGPCAGSSSRWSGRALPRLAGWLSALCDRHCTDHRWFHVAGGGGGGVGAHLRTLGPPRGAVGPRRPYPRRQRRRL